MFGFVGANGAGKTTTMRIVMGVLQADSGSVSWQGRPSATTTGSGSGTCPRSAACTRRCGSPIRSSISAACTG
ncbi:ATP-binding cassette domain-containing protein [Nonomuraea thailandensis]